jgi:hypothetical protein
MVLQEENNSDRSGLEDYQSAKGELEKAQSLLMQ